MDKKYLKPGALALGENNAKLNIWHGRYNGDVYDVTEQGFFKAYYKLLGVGDIIYLVVENGAEIDLVAQMVIQNSAKPEDVHAKEEFIKTKLISSTASSTELDIKQLKAQIKSELARQYGLKKVED